MKILIIVILIFGAKKLPELARSMGKSARILKSEAKAMKSDHVQALTAGANDYMAKPLDVDRLLSLVRIWMPKS